MEPQAILYHLAHAEGLPEHAIRTAREQRHAVAPALVDFVERHLAGEAKARELEPAMFFVFHLLGEWRETSAYRPLARLLAIDADKLDDLLGDAVTETSHRVMAAVFDGDPRPLYEVIEAEHANEFIRSRMLEAVAMITLAGGLDRAEVASYLRDGFMTLKPHAENFVWHGWQSAIALLGLSDLRSLVKKAFDRGLISTQTMEFEDFRRDLKHALSHPEAPWSPRAEKEFAPFGDTIEELSWWHAFSPEYLERKRAAAGDLGLGEPPAILIEASGATTRAPAAAARSSRSAACDEAAASRRARL